MSNSDDPVDEVISCCERWIAQSLLEVVQSVAIGQEIHDSPEFDKVLDGLEGFIPEVMREIDQNWSEICMDGSLLYVAYKIGERTIKIFGSCYILPGTFNPESTMYVRMQVDPTGKKVNWFECKFGLETRRPGGSRYRSHGERMAVFYSPDGHEDSSDWSYMVTYGTRDE